jgi:putative FmdB family regulatory protein
MPTYEYACNVCSHREDKVRVIAKRDQTSACPKCSAGVMHRDVAASMRPHTDMGFQTPVYSDSLGCNPEQIPEMQRRFPHHEYLPDGRLVMRSHTERTRIIKEMGFIDRS